MSSGDEKQAAVCGQRLECERRLDPPQAPALPRSHPKQRQGAESDFGAMLANTPTLLLFELLKQDRFTEACGLGNYCQLLLATCAGRDHRTVGS